MEEDGAVVLMEGEIFVVGEEIVDVGVSGGIFGVDEADGQVVSRGETTLDEKGIQEGDEVLFLAIGVGSVLDDGVRVIVGVGVG